jgi:hypothetical protein
VHRMSRFIPAAVATGGSILRKRPKIIGNADEQLRHLRSIIDELNGTSRSTRAETGVGTARVSQDGPIGVSGLRIPAGMLQRTRYSRSDGAASRKCRRARR